MQRNNKFEHRRYGHDVENFDVKKPLTGGLKAATKLKEYTIKI